MADLRVLAAGPRGAAAPLVEHLAPFMGPHSPCLGHRQHLRRVVHHPARNTLFRRADRGIWRLVRAGELYPQFWTCLYKSAQLVKVLSTPGRALQVVLKNDIEYLMRPWTPAAEEDADMKHLLEGAAE